MKAVVMSQFGSAETFAMQEVPKPVPHPGEVRIRIRAAGFNPVDWKIREGWYGGDPKLIIGCDCSGVVDALGPETDQFKVGDEVYAMSFFKSSNGSYAQYACIPVELVAKKPRNLSFEEAGTVPLAAMTAYRAVIASSAFKEGDVVFAAGIGGGVGIFAAQMLKGLGVKQIYTLAKDAGRSQFLQEKMAISANHILFYPGRTTEQLKESLLAMNRGDLFDATLDLVGGEMKRLCLELTGFSGHFSTILPESDFPWPFWSETAIPRARNLSVHQVAVGAEMGSSHRKHWQVYVRHLGRISDMLESGELHPPVVKVVGSLSEQTVREAHALLESGRVQGKLVMVVE